MPVRLTGFAGGFARRALGGVAADFALQLREIEELVRLTPQFLQRPTQRATIGPDGDDFED